MMKKTLVASTLALAVCGLGVAINTVPAHSQVPARIEGVDLARAKNLARQAAEEANGGLIEYRAEPAMHGPARQAPYVENADGSWTFTFEGRRPGSQTYTIESVVTVTPDGEVAIEYNGPIRAANAPRPTPEPSETVTAALEQVDLSRAKNLARQTAERINGGLIAYRAEPAMHGPVGDAPYEVNDNGSWTFTFQGREPGSSTYTIESVITVSSTGDITVDYNGPVR